MMRPWRYIVSRRREGWSSGIYGMKFGSSRVMVYFVCGHEQHYKASQAPKGDRARCRQCPVEKPILEQVFPKPLTEQP